MVHLSNLLLQMDNSGDKTRSQLILLVSKVQDLLLPLCHSRLALKLQLDMYSIKNSKESMLMFWMQKCSKKWLFKEKMKKMVLIVVSITLPSSLPQRFTKMNTSKLLLHPQLWLTLVVTNAKVYVYLQLRCHVYCKTLVFTCWLSHWHNIKKYSKLVISFNSR